MEFLSTFFYEAMIRISSTFYLTGKRVFRDLPENNPPTKGNGFYFRDLKDSFWRAYTIRVPRTRDNGFKSALLPYRKRITEDLDALIRAMLISGMSTRKIAEVLKELYEIKISYANISRISQVGIEEIQKWRSRPLMEEYAVVFLDAMVFPIKRDRVENESIYVAIGITPEGRREILGYYLPGGMEVLITGGKFCRYKEKEVSNRFILLSLMA
ncbi:transposase [Thermospira aquatica]|uniref:Mutator family transposase n=1 Tax=Thermospira aquatica TaxID=2828656 RepID=A0AAX3BDG4_9SPIR|nr:transposase [Thermospira aquatica]URA10310.1 transposase [Thermospira aquatica]